MSLSFLQKQFSGRAAFISWLVVALAIAIPFSIIIFNRIMHIGHPTSFPPSDVRSGWTPGPTTRGSINLVWACLSTIFTCVYVSLHLDVPITGSDPQPRDFQARCMKMWRTVSRKALFVMFNVAAPELVVYSAILDNKSAKLGVKKMKNIGYTNWTCAHAFFVDMGGLKVQVPSANRLPVAAGEEETNPPETLPIAGMGSGPGKSEKPNGDRRGRDAEKPSHSISAPKYYIVFQSGHDFYLWLEKKCQENPIEIDIEQLEREIQGMTKADSLLKTFTCIQAAWLVVQTIVRAIEHRPVSELKVTTCGYVFCALITYYLWWHKPYGVQTHILLRLPPTEGPRNQNTDPAPFNRQGWVNGGDRIAIFSISCIGAIIGAIHCTLWNATFVNSNGQVLWRICCIVQIASPLIALLIIVLGRLGMSDSDNAAFRLTFAFSLVSYFLHFCARIVLFILIGYSFWSLPEGVYTNIDWSWSWFPFWH